MAKHTLCYLNLQGLWSLLV